MKGRIRTKEQTAFVFGREMKPCPKCGSYNIGYQVPIKINIQKGASAKQMLGAYFREQERGPALEGYGFIWCWECYHKGEKVPTDDMTYDQASKSKEFADKMKDGWNETVEGK